MFYHIQIHHKHNYDEMKVNLTEEELLARIVEPYEQGVPIVLNGRTIPLDQINRIRIFQTADNLDEKIKKFKTQHDKDSDPYKIFDASPIWKAIESGTDTTDKYITGPPGFSDPINKEIKKSSKQNEISGKEQIFVVHGHDNALKDETCVFLTEIGFDPIVLHRKPDGGLTIIEKFEKYSDVKFAIILLTPDDYAFEVGELKKLDGQRKGEFRARQNVIFELGFFIGKLGRQSVCCLYKNVEIPTDILGMIYKKIDKNVEAIGYEIIKELKNAGLTPKIS